MRQRRVIVGLGAVLLAAAMASADVKVIFERSDHATPEFKFKTVPTPAKDDAGTKATFSIVDGRRDGNGAEISALNDGKLPSGQDEPRSNFFFAQGLDGGRIVVDLGRVVEVRQVNTYSWHSDTRGPQVYSVHGADGSAKDFNASPKRPADPEKWGWSYLADVDTRPAGKKVEEAGGQYGVSVTDSSGALGKFRYLLFDINETEDDDKFGNTFYSEIDVVTSENAEATPAPAAPPEPVAAEVQQPEVFRTADGKYQISIDTSVAPGLREWVDHSMAPVLLEWYPKIVEMLPSEGYDAPKQVMVVFQNPGHGVAATGGTRITCAAAWFEKNLEGEARGAIVHELVHVVQQYGRSRRDPGGTPAPGWLTEGIADYVRWFKYEPQSRGADRVRDPAHARFDASYRTSANFLNWASQKYDAELAKKLNAALRDGKYSPGLWQELTGKRVEELGDEWRASLQTK
jgi:hypothetical protein